jgi:hypothetical protein
MESSLHRQLKALYAPSREAQEVVCDGRRIDAVRDDELIEIQHGSLAAIRDKIRQLLARHPVRVVKPIVAVKHLVKLDERHGQVVGRRRSPKRGNVLDVFDELVYFTSVYPHQRLTLEVVLVDVEEWRYPGRGRRRRRRQGQYVVQDQLLLEVRAARQFRTAADLARLLPPRLPRKFHTGHLAERLGIPRRSAQRIVYCLRETGALAMVGKLGNAVLYQRRRQAA